MVEYYDDKKVFVMSFYLKSSIVGRNNNAMSNENIAIIESLNFYVPDLNSDYENGNCLV